MIIKLEKLINRGSPSKKTTKKHNIALKIISNKEKISKNIQGRAREIRYEKLKKFCKKNNINILMTAHNLEDQVETFFHKIVAWKRLAGLSAMKSLNKIGKNVKLFRPFLDTKKKVLIKVTKNIFWNIF